MQNKILALFLPNIGVMIIVLYGIFIPKVAQGVPLLMVLSYWDIGRELKEKWATYGKEVVKKIFEKLSLEYWRGYSRSNLERMMKLHTFFDKEICATLSRQLKTGM